MDRGGAEGWCIREEWGATSAGPRVVDLTCLTKNLCSTGRRVCWLAGRSLKSRRVAVDAHDPCCFRPIRSRYRGGPAREMLVKSHGGELVGLAAPSRGAGVVRVARLFVVLGAFVVAFGGHSAALAAVGWSAPAPVDLAVAPISVSCVPSSSFCVAVDVQGDEVTYRGGTWSSPTRVDSNGPLLSVSCPSSSFCAAVDLVGYVVTFNGATWSSPTKILSNPGVPISVSCVSSAFCLAVDNGGRAVIYNGSTWSQPASIDSNGGVNSASCTEGFPKVLLCVAVDNNGNAVTYDGSAWSQPASIDSNGGLNSVSCAPPSFCGAGDG